MKINQLLVALISSVFIFSCSRQNPDSDNRLSEEQKIGEFTQLKIKGVFNLYLQQGDKPSLRIEGDPSLTNKFKVSQSGDLLELELADLKTGFFSESKLEVFLTLGDLEELTFDGVGNIQSKEGLELNQLRIKGDGVGNINLEVIAEKIEAQFNMVGNIVLRGSANTFNLSNEGIGNIDASGLTAKNMNLSSSGIGKVAVHCTGDLSIIVNGIGAVSYTGNPNVIKEEVNGIGKVFRN
jgi:hypothetical protein